MRYRLWHSAARKASTMMFIRAALNAGSSPPVIPVATANPRPSYTISTLNRNLNANSANVES